MDELILMKLYTIVVYSLTISMMEDNTGIKGRSREIIIQG